MTSSGFSAGVNFAAWHQHAERGRPLDLHRFAAAAGAVAEAGRLRAGLDRASSMAPNESSASTLPPLPTTRRSAIGPFATATAAVESNRMRASAHAAPAGTERVLAFKPPFPRGLSWLAGDRSPGFRARSAAPSRGLCVTPSGRRQRARDFLDPVTVAGPRRLLTGLPLTTDRFTRASLYGETAVSPALPSAE